ncbi:lipoprotein 4 [Achromobacter arsenitoxydans SY8]|uniref:Lipoprotein 4 n=1 Tax=Achromobacter arsenitoxydans SY8 TaxID=477184 RepID=H0FES0_9BURK|nr:lipoprotein 4 [Achromobacter arsenitoxydans SY8]
MSAAAVLTLTGCTTPVLPYTYSPASALAATGDVGVGQFTYEPNKYLQSLPGGGADPQATRYPNAGLSTSQQHTGGPPGAYRSTYSQILPNQARNTAVGTVLFERNVADIIRDAAFTELRAIGITVAGPSISRELTGEVQNLMVDELGMNIDWTLRVVYTVAEKSNGDVVYSSVKEIKRTTPKFLNVLGALNDLIRLNIEALASDPQFLAVIQNQAQPTTSTRN